MAVERKVATVVEVEAGDAVLEFEDGERWRVAVPHDVDARVGMRALAIEDGQDPPVIGWAA